MKTKLFLAAMVILGASAAHAAPAPKAPEMVERKGNPTGVIASVVSVPASYKMVYLSGATASPPDPAKPDDLGDTKAQTLSILTKMKATLADMGMTMGDVVKINVFMVGPDGGHMDAPAMNEVFKTFFGTADQPNKPARTTVQVAQLGRPAVLLEIEGVAAKAP